MVIAHTVNIINPRNMLPIQQHKFDFIGAQTNVNL